MNVKKLAIIGAIVLVIIGCVLAAGCTSNTTTPTTPVQSSDSIAGVWYTTFTDAGQNVKDTITAKDDGTGYIIMHYDNGTVKVLAFTWTKNADGTFAIKTSEGNSRTWTLNSAKDTMTSSTGRTFAKKFAANSDAAKIIGVWKDDNHITTFNADGSGTTYKGEGNEISKFTWTTPETGKVKLQYVSGTSTTSGENLTGLEKILVYDAEKNTLTNTKSGAVRVRPTENMDGYTITKFASSQQTPAATGKCPVVGQWFCSDFKDNDGKTITAVQTIKADGTGYWFQVEKGNHGINLVRINKSTFDKTNWSGSFDKVSSDGNTYKMVYNSAKDVIVQDGKNTYTRIEPIVGIWTGLSSAEAGNGNTNIIMNADGTGIITISYDDGTAVILKLTWTKNADGTYALVFSDGTKRTYTVDSQGKTLKSDSGVTKTKQFLDTTFLVSVTGPWYNKDKDRVMIINADGTGIGKQKNGIFKFTWKVNDIGKFIITYTDGTDNEGSSLKGKTFEWTYDRDNEVFTSAVGTKYIRPTETIKDKITFK